MVNKKIFVHNFVSDYLKLKSVIDSTPGCETTSDYVTSDFIIPGLALESNRISKDLQDKGVVQEGMNFDLVCKEGFSKALVAAGIRDIDVCYDASYENIVRFQDTKFIIKPKISHSAFDRFNFTYKPFKNFADFATKVDMEDFKTNFIDSGEYVEYIVQRSLEDDLGIITQLFVGGFVNHLGEIEHEGISTVLMRFDPRQENERIASGGSAEGSFATTKYLSNFIRLSSEHLGDGFDDKHNFIAQLQKLFNFYNIKSVPFICQALVDPKNPETCFLTDFAYKIRPLNYKHKARHEYLKDKINFMYNKKKCLIPETSLYIYPNIDIQHGLTKELITYLEENEISCDIFGQRLLRRNLPFQIFGSTEAELRAKEKALRDFIANYGPEQINQVVT